MLVHLEPNRLSRMSCGCSWPTGRPEHSPKRVPFKIALDRDPILHLTPMLKDLHPSVLVYANLHYLRFHALPLASNYHCMPEASY